MTRVLENSGDVSGGVSRRGRSRVGYAMPAVLVTLVMGFGMWALLYHGASESVNHQQARVLRAYRELWTAPAMARGLYLLETGDPPSSPYTCKVSVTRDGVTQYFLLTYQNGSGTLWSVDCEPTTEDDPAPDAPSEF